MVDLDALKAELEAAGHEVRGGSGWLNTVRPWTTIWADGRVLRESGEIDAREFERLAIIARHVAPVVTPEAVSEHIAKVLSERVDTRITPDAARELSTIVVGSTPEPDAEVRDVLAEACLDEAYYHSDGECWVDPNRIPEGDDPDDWTPELVQWEQANDDFRKNGYRMADAGLAALRDKGFAVVRTADVEAARDCARGMALECRGKPKDDYNALADRLQETIR